jgi:hypothetical protein
VDNRLDAGCRRRPNHVVRCMSSVVVHEFKALAYEEDHFVERGGSLDLIRTELI